MKKSLSLFIALFINLFITVSAWAEPLPTQLNIAPDQPVNLDQITRINYACAKKRAQRLFEDITGVTCVEMNQQDLKADSIYRYSDFGCKRRTPTKNPADIQVIVYALEKNYTNAFFEKGDKRITLNLTYSEDNYTSSYYRAKKPEVPFLIIKPGATLKHTYGSFGELESSFYTGADLVMTGEINATVFWKNSDTSREIESLPVVRSLEIQCIQDELGKL